MSDQQEELIEKILAEIASMKAMGIDKDTIRYHAITQIGSSDFGRYSGFKKMLFLGMIEKALEK